MNRSFPFESDGSVGESFEEDSSAPVLALTSTSPSFSSMGGSAPGVMGLFFGVFGRARVGLSSVKSNCGDIRLEKIVAKAMLKERVHHPTSRGGWNA